MRLDAIRRLWQRLRASRADPNVLDSDSFTDSERAVGRMILPLISDLENAQRTIGELTRATQALDAVLRALPVAAIVIDDDGHFLTSNVAARELYGGESIPASLMNAILRAIREGTEHHTTDVAHPSLRDVTLRVVPAEVGGAAGGAAVVFLVSGSESLVEPKRLGRELGLTSAQAKVVSLVAEGLSNKEVSARLGISIETVRKHLGAAYRRAGVSNRAGIVAAAYGARWGQSQASPS